MGSPHPSWRRRVVQSGNGNKDFGPRPARHVFGFNNYRGRYGSQRCGSYSTHKTNTGSYELVGEKFITNGHLRTTYNYSLIGIGKVDDEGLFQRSLKPNSN